MSIMVMGDVAEWYSANVIRNNGLAFGRRIAERITMNAALRTGWLPVGWPSPVDPGPLRDGLIAALLLALAALLVRSGFFERLFAEPARVATATAAALALLAQPGVALAGGDGGGGGGSIDRWHVTDHLGSNALVVTGSGAVAVRRALDAWGRVFAEDVTETAAARLFTGQRFEETTGLYDLRAHWHDPDTGRFLVRSLRGSSPPGRVE